MEQLQSTARPLEELCSPEVLGKALPGHRKSASIVVQTCQSCLPSRNDPLLQRRPGNIANPRETLYSSARANPARPWGVHFHHEKENNKQEIQKNHKKIL